METQREVFRPITSTFRDGSVQSCDSSPTFKAINSKAKQLRTVPIVTVVHGKKPKPQWVKKCRLQVSKMSKKLKKGLNVKPGQRSVTVGAGDECVEGLFGNAKAGMRRVNMMGRRTSNRAHINFLASCWQLRHPGLDGVIEAFKIHRQGVLSKVPPSKVYTETSWLI